MSSIRIDENKMRVHFFQCLEQGRFEPFPEKQTDVATFFSPECVISVEILCSCRMLWVWYHIKNPALNMADCDTCHQWYHRKCEKFLAKCLMKIVRSNGTAQVAAYIYISCNLSKIYVFLKIFCFIQHIIKWLCIHSMEV